MKNLTKIFTAVVAGMFAFSCVTDTTEDLGINAGAEVQSTVTASLEQARTQLGEKADGVYPLYWSEGDAIAVNGVASNPLTAGGSDNATFSFNEEVVYPIHAVYPASAAGVVAEAEGAQVVTFAAEQPYTAGTFAPGVAPMYGYAEAEGEAVQFNHLSGVLCFKLKGNGEVLTSATINAEKGAIAGNFDIDCTNGTLTAHADATSTVSVTFGEGLTLGEEATPIYVAVPAGDHGYVSITLNTADAKKMTIKFNSSNKPIAVGVVREFAEVEFEANNLDSDWFEIYDVADMLSFAKNAANFPWVGAKLMAAIDMSEVDWTPAEGFSKIFDGNRDAGHKIIGLNAPLFGTTTATIKNLDLNVNIATSSSAYYTSATTVMALGGLACYSGGPISDSTVSGSVYWSHKTSTYTYIFVGGFVGQALDGTSFSNVDNKANISAEKHNNTTFLGGIAAMAGVSGGADVSFYDCTNSGTIKVNEKTVTGETNRNSYVAGILGASNVNVSFEDCSNSGAITHEKAYTKNAYVAGIYGRNFSTVNVQFKNLTNTGAITSNTTYREGMGIGGILGEHTSKEGNNIASDLTNTGAITVGGTPASTVYIGGIAGRYDGVSGKNNTVTTWTNSGAVVINLSAPVTDGAAAPTGAHYYGGVIGYTRYTNCANVVNHATVTIDGNASVECYAGGAVGRLSSGTSTNIVNEATAIVTNRATSKSRFIAGGAVGQISYVTVDGLHNKATFDFQGKISVGVKEDGYEGPAVGGTIGMMHSLETYDELYNAQNISLTGEFTMSNMNGALAPYISFGGVIGYVSYYNLDNVDNNSKQFTLETTATVAIGSLSSGNNHQLRLGGIVGRAYPFGGATNCDNNADLVWKADNRTFHGAIGGLFGYAGGTATAPSEISNCTNNGDIYLESTFGIKRCRFAALVGEYTSGNITNSTNNGDIHYRIQRTTNQNYIGGIVGDNYAGNGGSWGLVENCVNNGTLTFYENTLPNAENRIGGIVGVQYKGGEDKPAYCKGCTNNGDIVVYNQPAVTTLTNVHIGGILANPKTGNPMGYGAKDCKQNANIIALNESWTNIGMICADTRSAVTPIKDCKIVAGKSIAKSQRTVTDTDAGGETITETVYDYVNIDASNYFNYIYGGAAVVWEDETYDGCTFVTE